MTGRERPAGGGELRVSDRERERAAGLLADHYALGRLTDGELAERAGAVWAARTRTELDAPLADLPGRDRNDRPAVTMDTRLLVVLLCTAPPAAGVYWLICRRAARRQAARRRGGRPVT
ncbi:DUF1707 SHOCT-like domain-containing protein [Actinacidiphila acidipaludis]|uniref:DUF1707 domain-containing protein n=1 Tax=Actinacidiphila acidipaludis TaxID=2873382 RepID=A0ABS7QGG0_9ACTN|nr:DUF1707 domain-containing protein [Streptomyces acidipaludis]MBY8882261.1 DUF1707 domain-containing protein [Streptomyces acidipaludis]